VKRNQFAKMSEGQPAEGQEAPVEARGKVGRGEAGEGAVVDSVEASERQDRQEFLNGNTCLVG
jgi:hypothetical protein